jgi:hypothetical protein
LLDSWGEFIDELLIAGELQESSKRAVLNALKRIDDVFIFCFFLMGRRVRLMLWHRLKSKSRWD